MSIISAGFLYHYFGEPLLVTCWHLLKLFYFCSRICILLKKKLRSYKKICKMNNKTMTIKGVRRIPIFILSLVQSNPQIREFFKGVICEKWRQTCCPGKIFYINELLIQSKTDSRPMTGDVSINFFVWVRNPPPTMHLAYLYKKRQCQILVSF